jgi:hypothetical protein
MSCRSMGGAARPVPPGPVSAPSQSGFKPRAIAVPLSVPCPCPDGSPQADWPAWTDVPLDLLDLDWKGGRR